MTVGQFESAWRDLASHGDKHVRAIARRLVSDPLATKYFPYASHSNVHLSRNDTFPWEGDDLPFIAVCYGEDESYQAHDGDFRPRARGDLETAARAFLELLAEVERLPSRTERRNDFYEKTLKRCRTLLSRWTGTDATMRELTVSHRTLRIDLSRRGERNFLGLACLGPYWISGPVQWSNANIEVMRLRVTEPPDTTEHMARLLRLLDDGDGFLVRDEAARLEVVCASVEVGEHVYPWT